MALTLISAEKTTITGYVKTGESVTAGNFVKADASSSDVVTSSGMSSYASSDIQISECDASGDQRYCLGIAGTDGSAGDYIPIYRTGLFIVRAGEAITAGLRLKKAQSTDAAEVEAVDAATDTYDGASGAVPIGQALTTSSAADAYIIMALML